MKIKTINRDEITCSEVYLVDTRSIEREFQRVLNWHKDAFWDENSLALMKEIDNAKRDGDYGVVTHIGESCITCLSTGCKFGLLVLYYSRKAPHLKLIIESHVVGENVWEWLAKHTDVILYIFPENLNSTFVGVEGLAIIHEGMTYKMGVGVSYWDLLWGCEDIPFTMTKEKEAKAYELYFRYIKQPFFCNLKEEITLKEFITRFPEHEWFIQDVEEDYKVINYLNYLPLEFPSRRHPLYVCGEKEGKIECCKINSTKYPSLLDIIFYDVLDGDYYTFHGKSEVHKFCEEYDRWFVLVLNGDEKCLIRDYPKETLLGIEVEKENKCIKIYDPIAAVEHFHEIYQKSIPVG